MRNHVVCVDKHCQNKDTALEANALPSIVKGRVRETHCFDKYAMYTVKFRSVNGRHGMERLAKRTHFFEVTEKKTKNKGVVMINRGRIGRKELDCGKTRERRRREREGRGESEKERERYGSSHDPLGWRPQPRWYHRRFNQVP